MSSYYGQPAVSNADHGDDNDGGDGRDFGHGDGRDEGDATPQRTPQRRDEPRVIPELRKDTARPGCIPHDTDGCKPLDLPVPNRDAIGPLALPVTKRDVIGPVDIREETHSFHRLIQAVQEGQLSTVRKLTASGCDVQRRDHFGLSALNYAVKGNQWDCFLELSRAQCYADLLTKGSQVDHLVSAIYEGASDQFIKLVGKWKFIRGLTEVERSALLFLAITQECHPDSVQALVDKRSINTRYHLDMTPLMVAVVTGNHRTLETLLLFNPDVYARDCCLKKTAFCYAIEKGCSQCLELLLESVYSTTHNANSIAFERITGLAVKRDQNECLSVLLNWNRSRMIDSVKTEVLLCKAAKCGSAKCLDVLLEHGINASCSTAHGITPLMLAVIHDRPECFSRLLQHGVLINATDYKGNSALMHSLRGGRLQFVDALLDRGINASCSTDQGITPLMLAVIYDRPECFFRLLQHGVSIDATNRDGKSALTYALLRDRLHFLPTLLALGAQVDLANILFNAVLSMNSCQRRKNVLEILLPSLPASTPLCVEKYSWTFRSKAKSFDVKALNSLMECGIFRWHWMDDINDVSPELIAQAAVRSGTRPGQFCKSNETMTLLRMALSFSSAETVRFLMANLYLSNFDVKVVRRDTNFNNTIRKRQQSPELIALLDQLSHEPWSLQTLSFLAVSFALETTSSRHMNAPLGGHEKAPLRQLIMDATPSGHENTLPMARFKAMIQRLPIPPKFIDRLLFQTPLSRVCVDNWSVIGLPPSTGDSRPVQVNLMSNKAPIWKGCSVPYPECATGRCSHNDQGFRRRYRRLEERLNYPYQRTHRIRLSQLLYELDVQSLLTSQSYDGTPSPLS